MGMNSEDFLLVSAEKGSDISTVSGGTYLCIYVFNINLYSGDIEYPVNGASLYLGGCPCAVLEGAGDYYGSSCIVKV
ncbi:hypothetical protein ES703_78288 [subsurface metagenome]